MESDSAANENEAEIYLSDLSDYFDEDAHLLDATLTAKTQELSLDEVTYDRDINRVNVASGTSQHHRGRFNAADLAKLVDIKTSDPKDPTYARQDKRRERRKRNPKNAPIDNDGSRSHGPKKIESKQRRRQRNPEQTPRSRLNVSEHPVDETHDGSLGPIEIMPDFRGDKPIQSISSQLMAPDHRDRSKHGRREHFHSMRGNTWQNDFYDRPTNLYGGSEPDNRFYYPYGAKYNYPSQAVPEYSTTIESGFQQFQGGWCDPITIDGVDQSGAANFKLRANAKEFVPSFT